jgi:hypothetical protein
MRFGTCIVSALVLLFSAWFVIESFDLPGGVTLGEPGPARMPVAIGVLAMALSGTLLIYTFLTKDGEAVRFPRIGEVGLFAASVLIYGLVISLVGFYAATALFLLTAMVLLRTRWRTAAGVAGGFLAFVFLIFDKLLSVPLP